MLRCSRNIRSFSSAVVSTCGGALSSAPSPPLPPTFSCLLLPILPLLVPFFFGSLLDLLLLRLCLRELRLLSFADGSSGGAVGGGGGVRASACKGVYLCQPGMTTLRVNCSEKGVRSAQKLQVGPCMPVGTQLELEQAEVGPTSWPTWRLSHLYPIEHEPMELQPKRPVWQRAQPSGAGAPTRDHYSDREVSSPDHHGRPDKRPARVGRDRQGQGTRARAHVEPGVLLAVARAGA